MSLENRRRLIRRLEELRQSKVIVYATSDRQFAAAQMGDDMVRPFLDHLRAIGHTERLDLLIYSRGGAIDVPWRIVSALRQTADEWNALIPFRANSGATLVALGADKILFGRGGELGPIDPIMTVQNNGQQEQINVEDVMAYVKFIQDKVNITEQEALSTSLAKLADHLNPVLVGNVYRTHLHIRDVAKRVIGSRKNPPDQAVLDAIVETLAAKVYAHGHAIGYRDAHAMGLPVEKAADETETVMWDLLCEYEEQMKLRDPVDPAVCVATTDTYGEDVVLAVLESPDRLDEFGARLEVRAKRQVPPTLNVGLNFNLMLPGGAPGGQPPMPQQVLQQLLQQVQQQIGGQAQQAVTQAIQQQAPLLGADVRMRGGKWARKA